MKQPDSGWLRDGSVQRKNGNRAGRNYSYSPFCLILDIEHRLRKMNRDDSRAFLEMLRTIFEMRIHKQACVKRLSRYVE
jgi:hypothetical protein